MKLINKIILNNLDSSSDISRNSMGVFGLENINNDRNSKSKLYINVFI